MTWMTNSAPTDYIEIDLRFKISSRYVNDQLVTLICRHTLGAKTAILDLSTDNPSNSAR